MKKTVWLAGILVLGSFVFGCSSNIDKGPVLRFIQGIQDGNKKKMYEATNLTGELVNESREKLIYPGQNRQTEHQRKDAEHALRISGEIDLFSTKLKRLLPGSAVIRITKSMSRASTGDTAHADHSVRITYGNRQEAMIDKTGRTVREMDLHLQQATRSINGRSIHEFSFNSEDFEKIADRDFEVSSYF